MSQNSEQMSVEKRNAIAYQLLVYMATQRKPELGFLSSFSGKNNQNVDGDKILNHFLQTFSLEELKTFTKQMFSDGLALNLEFFDSDFDRKVAEHETKKRIGFNNQ